MQKSKIHLFWDNCQKNWLWINLGAYVSGILFMWVLYYFDIMSLRSAIIMTVVPPIGIILITYSKTITNKHTFLLLNKIMLVGVVGFVITIPVFLFAGYLLIIAPWAPINLYLHPLWFVYAIYPLIFIMIYPFIGFFLYRFGEKKEWHISPYY
ncbi:hypothetical protein [Candidatus Lokiarchaeum ossiferum]|uniref:hypothetical protein n=1 Tax=Candidatus Lokiarchaeum ossiferum TaxID=2951803 RepID=UPI00352FC9DB